MKRKCLPFALLLTLSSVPLLVSPVSGQVTDGEKHLRNLAITGESGWKTETNLTIAFSQVSLTDIPNPLTGLRYRPLLEFPERSAIC